MNLADLELLGVLVKVDGAELLIDAPAGVITDDLIAQIRACKAALLDELRPANDPAPITYGTGRDAYGKPLPASRLIVTCGDCHHFQIDAINPSAGAGICGAGVGHLTIGPALHPMAQRLCDEYQRSTNQ